MPEFMMLEMLSKPVWMWLAFIAIVIVLLAFDLGVLNRKEKDISIRESLWLSAFYIGIACLFGAWIWHQLGAESGMLFYTGFIVEKTLAMDNVFVISLVFSYFAVPRKYQHRVLLWGILGVIVLRGIMIGLGAAIVAEAAWVLYIFAVFLIFTGVKMLVMGEGEMDISKNPALKFLKKNFRVTNDMHGQKFFVKLPDPKGGGKLVRFATPLFVCLIIIEIVDVVFAVDSVPAIFAITTDPYLVYTSNIFAILGLRALYFALAAIVHKFHYLKPALALVLVFIGSKIFIADWMGLEKFPALISLGITLALIIGGVVASLLLPKKENAAH
jgi:tellurite resistance protein TerC